jgi:hypothetical protein
MKPGRLALAAIGSMLGLIGLSAVTGGTALSLALATQRDGSGYFTTSTEQFTTDAYAITSAEFNLGDPRPTHWWGRREAASVRVRATGAEGVALFVGIAPERDVEAYLADVPHDDVTDVRFDPFVAQYRREHGDGLQLPMAPQRQSFWVANSTGLGTQTVTWSIQPGRWAIVVMNADGSANVTADVNLGGRVHFLVPMAIGLVVGGLVLAAVGIGMVIVALANNGRLPPPKIPPSGSAPIGLAAAWEAPSPERDPVYPMHRSRTFDSVWPHQ